jgi:hypothetical protein
MEIEVEQIQDTDIVQVKLNSAKVTEDVSTNTSMTYANLKLLEAEGAKWNGTEVITGE